MPQPIESLAVTAMACVNALGKGVDATFNAIQTNSSGLIKNNFNEVSLDTWIGRVPDLEAHAIKDELSDFECRNNRLADLGLRQDRFIDAVLRAKEKYGASRIAVLIGTSTSGILSSELAYRGRPSEDAPLPDSLNYQKTQNLFSVADFVRRYFGLQGPAVSVSTACSSSAKVFANASRLLRHGLCDAAVVGGVDSLCLSTLYGFASLELLSNEPCRPCDVQRKGISIGEAAGFMLLERVNSRNDSDILFCGYGESSDAYHMSTPHPEGEGARLAMGKALQSACIEAADIGYINMHGTATIANDRSEDRAIYDLFADATPVSSTKGWTGHTLGAAGITEAIIACLCLCHSLIPGTLNTIDLDPSIKSQVVLQNESQALKYVLSNSFGFGGNNCSLVFART